MKLRHSALAALCCLGLTAGAANAMPSVESFYAKDEGAKVARVGSERKAPLWRGGAGARPGA
jgi:hypothetical protein